jgi:hypothetical protein
MVLCRQLSGDGPKLEYLLANLKERKSKSERIFATNTPRALKNTETVEFMWVSLATWRFELLHSRMSSVGLSNLTFRRTA